MGRTALYYSIVGPGGNSIELIGPYSGKKAPPPFPYSSIGERKANLPTGLYAYRILGPLRIVGPGLPSKPSFPIKISVVALENSRATSLLGLSSRGKPGRKQFHQY
jgi:hypothetical protein